MKKQTVSWYFSQPSAEMALFLALRRDGTFLSAPPRWHLSQRFVEMALFLALRRDGTFLSEITRWHFSQRNNEMALFLAKQRDGTFLSEITRWYVSHPSRRNMVYVNPSPKSRFVIFEWQRGDNTYATKFGRNELQHQVVQLNKTEENSYSLQITAEKSRN